MINRHLRLLLIRQTVIPRSFSQLRSCRYSTAPPSLALATPIEPRTYSTPLARHLTEAIKTTGPIPLATYMRQCLTSDIGGYYTGGTEGADPFGSKGDFITSPAISQLFGEMVGIWIVSEWLGQGPKSTSLQLVELGPGRGTLMDDVLRTLSAFKPLASSISGIYLIEASPSLRETQTRFLCGASATLTNTPDGGITALSKPEHGSVPITWYDTLQQIPKQATTAPFILAHEFFDALPIHAFQATPSGWRELLVYPSPSASATSSEFVLSQADKATPHSMLLPELSERYRALKSMPGSIIEISPESLSIVGEIARRIGTPHSGAALIMDYGPLDTIPANSLRGIKGHKMVSPLSGAGEVDVSADVDFHALVEQALGASEEVEVHGPVEQGTFLAMMGIQERLAQLAKRVDGEAKKTLETGLQRLVGRDEGAMGAVYKVLSIVPERGGKGPVGFGGGVRV